MGKMLSQKGGETMWRRFELLWPENEKALVALVEAKGLSRENIILILETLALKDFHSDETAR